ncbi:hypothetical protein Taro_018344 [Colocasia esculenta]|uniref:Bowman-Birk serine protease inhibitors family domain-containing protein n=1 Tax=Colocasia esculenta TaxID=4460 RepID=A0A843UTN2_COLES|nr:hypothetical protein [Colocasia esculenta]
MAGARKSGMAGMWVTTLLVVLIAASLLASPATARDPFVGLSIKGGWLPPPPPRSLRCCDDCRCGDRSHGPPCSCYDNFSREDGCPRGCMHCIPDFERNTFSCFDPLESCPARCGCRSPAAGTASSSAATCGAGAATGI